MVNFFDIYKIASIRFQTIFNVNMYDFVKSYSNEKTVKALIYKLISDCYNIKNLNYNQETFVSDGLQLFTKIDLLIKDFNEETKENLDMKKLAEFLYKNINENIPFVSVYTIYGYLTMNDYNIEKIKEYDDDKLKILIKKIYTDIGYNLLENAFEKIYNIYSKELRLIDANMNEKIKEILDKSIEMYQEVEQL